MTDRSPDVSLTQDEGFVATTHKGLTYPLGTFAPASGTLHRLAPGVRWARIGMPGSLGHINCWVIDDTDGVTVVDTGMRLPGCRAEWETIFSSELSGQRVTRIIGTHMHPDHIGLAGWFSAQHDAPVWMTRAEWLTVKLLVADARDAVPDEVVAFRRGAGWSAEQIDAGNAFGWGRLRHIIHHLPLGYRRIADGDRFGVGEAEWRVVSGSGHSPEHACLLNERDRLLIAGDQVLPRISSNVSLGAAEPDADPLGEWLASIAKLLTLSDDLLVLPGHGEPFRGLHARLHALDAEHRARLDELAVFIAEAPRRAVDCFGRLFRRRIEGEMLGLATGEALAHLRRLEVEGRAVRDVEDGVWWWRSP